MMQSKNILFLVSAASLLLPSAAFPQVAERPLLPEGQLQLVPGNISTLKEEHPTRSYGSFGFYGGNQEYKDDTAYDISGDTLLAAADFFKRNTYLSIGYMTTSYNRETVTDGSNLNYDQDFTNLGGRISFLLGEDSVLAIQAFIETEKRTATASSLEGSISASAELQFVDIVVGATTDFSEHFSGGFWTSPAVSDKSAFNGALSGTETKAGHGFIGAAGIGYNSSGFGAGIDLGLETENIGSDSQEGRTVSVSAEMVLDQLSLIGAFAVFQNDELTDSGEYILPANEGASLRVKVKKQIDALVFGLEYAALQLTGSDYGNATADADRFDFTARTLITFFLSTDI